MIADADLRFLSALPYFRGLSGDELARIAGRCQWRESGEGALIAVEGQPADGLYVVRSGKVRVFKTSSRESTRLDGHVLPSVSGCLARLTLTSEEKNSCRTDNDDVPGAGLGLAIARRVLRAHGGDLTAANGPSGGALRTATLPAASRSEPSKRNT